MVHVVRVEPLGGDEGPVTAEPLEDRLPRDSRARFVSFPTPVRRRPEALDRSGGDVRVFRSRAIGDFAVNVPVPFSHHVLLDHAGEYLVWRLLDRLRSEER